MPTTPRGQEIVREWPGGGPPGTLDVPRGARGLVVFAHGRDAAQESTFARRLRASGLATLLFELTEVKDARRFDVRHLADKLKGVTEWAVRQPTLRGLPLGYFGVGTGASVALVAAAELPQHVKALVSRGGRPDLAGPGHLALVEAPTLLIVGSEDTTVLALNEEARERMHAATVELDVIPGATHRFEEAGMLEAAADLARAWFERYLIGRSVSQARPSARDAGVSHSGDRL